MTAPATSVNAKRTSGSTTWRRNANARSTRNLDRETRRTNCSNIFRWYRGGWGRYSQADPLALDAFTPRAERKRVARALFEYVYDNPLRYTDSLGLKGCSGSCGVDCPGGYWVGGEVGASAGILFGKSVSQSVYFCTSSSRRCNFESKCTTVGIQAGAGIGATFGGFKGCQCASDIAATNSLSLDLLVLPPFQLNAGGGTLCMGVAFPVNYPVVSLPGLSVVGSLCETTLIGCMF
jgi:hypothetical protein